MIQLDAETAASIRRLQGDYPITVRTASLSRMFAIEVRVATIPVLQIELHPDNTLDLYRLAPPSAITPKTFRDLADFALSLVTQE